MDRTDRAGLYLHIPFCAGKCPYCDFYSLPSDAKKEACVSALIDEIKTKRRCRDYIKDRDIEIDTVYFGGGTPSLLSGREIKALMKAIRENYILSENAEITAECNPSSKNADEFLYAAAESGVNRISLGMQSSVTEERRKLGRRGDSASVERAIEEAKKNGISNISLDIMLGIPLSTEKSLGESLDFAISMGVPHISAYMLKLEEGTYFYKNADKLSLPSDDETADMYLFMCERLRKNGFAHYEISNFCKNNMYSRHNMKYWLLSPYIGIGPAAHSFYGGKRFYFPRDIDAFINGEKALFEDEGGGDDEKLMLPIRTDRGISLLHYNESFRKKAVLFEKNGLASIKNDILTLTDKGFLISNQIISSLLLEIQRN